MSKSYIFRLCGLVALVLFATTARADTAVLVLSQAALAPNDYTTWGQLGADGTVIFNGAMATSIAGNTITIDFGGGGSGLTSVECPAAPSCSWTGGFNAGDTLIWTNDGTNGTGPLDLSFGTPVQGAGLELQSDYPGSFTGEVQVEFSDNTFSPVFTVNSDGSGNPVFLGLLSTSANVAAINFNIDNSGSNNDFAADTLYSVNPSAITPEPASLILFGTGLAAISWKKIRPRAARS